MKKSAYELLKTRYDIRSILLRGAHMKKKANGEGSIVKRKDGRYMARYTMGDKRCAIYGSTFEEVRVQLTDTLSRIDQGIHITPTGYTVSQ